MNENQIEFMGQKASYPNSWPACMAVLFVCLSIVAIVYVIPFTSNEKIGTVARIISGVTNAKGEPQPDATYKLGFWTPSIETTKFWQAWLEESEKNRVAEQNVWELDISNEEKAIEFGKKLSCSSCPATGYRRYSIIGKGRSMEKPGYWWVATINEDYALKYFVRMYAEHWGSADSIYVELMQNVDEKYED